jgi:hypothetical protein
VPAGIPKDWGRYEGSHAPRPLHAGPGRRGGGGHSSRRGGDRCCAERSSPTTRAPSTASKASRTPKFRAVQGGASLTLPATAGSSLTIVTADIPAGSWVISGKTDAVNFSSSADIVRCSILATGAVGFGSSLTVGASGNGVTVGPVTPAVAGPVRLDVHGHAEMLPRPGRDGHLPRERLPARREIGETGRLTELGGEVARGRPASGARRMLPRPASRRHVPLASISAVARLELRNAAPVP